MVEPNEQLRRARERVESPHATGEPLSRQELAELVNKWVFEYTGRNIALDANYIGKLEQGVIRWPQDADRRAAFRGVLGVKTDADLGFRRPRRTKSILLDIDRAQLFTAALRDTATASRSEFAAERILTTQPTPIPAVIGMTEALEVHNAASAFEGWDALYGGGLVREAVTAQLQYCAQLLGARYSDRVRTELFSGVGYLAHVTGFMAFDAYAHEDAQRMFRFALSCAEEVADWHLRAKVLSSLARQAIWCGDPDAGLTFTELAMVRSDRLTSTERAMLHTGRARALAKLGDIEATVRAVGAADEEFGRTRPSSDSPWMKYYDAAQHAGDTGHALWDIGVNGHFVTEAQHRLSTAVVGHDDEFARARAISQTKLASLVMATGDPVEAAAAGHQALDWAGTIRSRRAADDLRDLRRFGAPHNRLAEVEELRQRIGTAVIA
nr:XRE family transcriptional regulator [Kibdelosporangium sp. MJ126-NF4]CEL18591.1 Putative arylsulfatase regulatory protein [Kibdelosporangium sp. MJ126-NF4]CTQ98076.1 Putative arylsulfatase regulatory protein [Kibdelosporangium sp. MJ126-NF4]